MKTLIFVLDVFFFFQAEDGIRYYKVTGVQTCALPILAGSAPRFAELAGELYERLAGRVLVAHNARFDYGFLRHEFERAGLRFQARTLCTVKLSRRLYPGHARHNLDSLIDRHGLKFGLRCNARHRALGDAQAVWQFLRVAAEERGSTLLQETVRELSQLRALPAHIDRAMVDEIPDSPGVYLFYGEDDVPLYVGKSVAMRSRVLQHFTGDLRSAREAEMARELRRVEWRRSCGELGALLRESQVVKQLAPVFNRQLRSANGLCGLSFDSKRLNLIQKEEINSENLYFLCGEI